MSNKTAKAPKETPAQINNVFKIDTGIPAPRLKGSGDDFGIPFADMNLGASIFLASSMVPTKDARRVINREAKRLRDAKTGHTLVQRSVTEDGHEGIRVWKVEAKAETAAA